MIRCLCSKDYVLHLFDEECDIRLNSTGDPWKDRPLTCCGGSAYLRQLDLPMCNGTGAS